MVEWGRSHWGRLCIPHRSFVLLADMCSRQGAFTRLMGTSWFRVREVITFLTYATAVPWGDLPAAAGGLSGHVKSRSNLLTL